MGQSFAFILLIEMIIISLKQVGVTEWVKRFLLHNTCNDQIMNGGL